MSESIELKIRNAYQMQKHSKCLELIDSLPSATRDSSQYKILKASCLNVMPGRSSEALAILDSVIASDSTPNPLALFGKGLCLISEGNFIDAVKCFEHAIELEPSDKMDKARAMKDRAEKMMMSLLAKRREAAKPNEENKCKVCHKIFTKNFSLTRHMLLHTGHRPFKCSICSYGFIQKSDLLRHEATHKAEFNFHCLYCTKRFKTKKNLQCHSSTHKEDRPFKCPKCPKSFKLEKLLIFHVNLHGNRTYQCDLCDMSFLTKPVIFAHIQECHTKKSGNIALQPLDIKPDPADIVLTMDTESGKEEEIPTIKIKDEPCVDNSVRIFQQEPIEIKSEPLEISDSNEEGFEVGEVLIGGEELNYADNYAPIIINDEIIFMQSLIKDMQRMSEEQRGDFQRKTRMIIDEMLK